MSRLAVYERALVVVMGRKNHRSVEPAKLPMPNPPELIVRRVPKPPRVKKTNVCRFNNCKRIAAVFIYDGGLCEEHADRFWERVEMRDAKKRHEDILGREDRDRVRDEARKINSVERKKPTSVGEIYFIQTDGLIKVGWSTKLLERMRHYGPRAVLLAHYKATMADETNLHRQLAPCRVKGREWYEDGPIVRDFIARVIAQYGKPRFTTLNWTEPKTVVAGKRAGRR